MRDGAIAGSNNEDEASNLQLLIRAMTLLQNQIEKNGGVNSNFL